MRRNFVSLAVFSILIISGCMISADPVGHKVDWKDVDEAIAKGLPKSAIEQLGPVIINALARKAYDEATRGILTRVMLACVIEGNKPEEKIIRLAAEIESAPDEVRPVIETMHALWYWRYFDQNRWRFSQRTATEQALTGDFTTWDLLRLFSEIDRRFTGALTRGQALKTSPISAWSDLLERGNLPDSYRPTLYDVLAQAALDFYKTGEQGLLRPEEPFEFSDTSPAFAASKEFMAWSIPLTDTNAPSYKALRLFQELMRFHEADVNQHAFQVLDVERLMYARNTAYGKNKLESARIALEQAAQRMQGSEVQTYALCQVAEVIRAQGDLASARAVAAKGVAAAPASAGAGMCRALIGQIDARDIALQTEYVWNQPLSPIQVQYKNLTNVYFRIIPYDWDKLLAREVARPENFSYENKEDILTRKSVLEFARALPATTNYVNRIEELPAPESLKPGYYFLVASCNPDFGKDDNQVSYADFWVSDLALVVRQSNTNLTGFVLDALSGEPLTGADVEPWFRDNKGRRVKGATSQTDMNGAFSIPNKDNGYGCLLKARYKDRLLASNGEYSRNWQRDENAHNQTILFTDRRIYRPGQTIHFKGIHIACDPGKGEYRPLPRANVEIVFEDGNSKEIGHQTLVCNDYGSFSGTFTAPSDRLMGRMVIRHYSIGAASIQVEEYKRPKFQVTFEPSKDAIKLEAMISLKGKAAAYTGAAIDGANAQYRVYRAVQRPYWCWWRHGSADSGGSQEIAHGTIKTGQDGTFVVAFPALPDKTIPKADEPIFTFRVAVTVTDSAGETRSSETSVRAGYTALAANMTASEWQETGKPVDIKVTTETLAGERMRAQGTLTIYSLKAPARVQRSALIPSQYIYGWFSRANDNTNDMSNPDNWLVDRALAERKVDTTTNGNVLVEFPLKQGCYRALFETRDAFGAPVKAWLPIRVLNPDARQLGIPIPNMVSAPTWTGEPGTNMLVYWGTGYDAGRAFVEVEHHGRIVKKYWTRPGNTLEAIALPIAESDRGGFYLHVTQVRENRAYFTSHYVDIPWSDRKLDLAWEHMTSKLLPGAEDTWSLTIRGPDALAASAELVATLYDASLDQFMSHQWLEKLDIFYRDSSRINSIFDNTPKPFHGAWGSLQGGPLAAWLFTRLPDALVRDYYGYGYLEKMADRSGVTTRRSVKRGSRMNDEDGLAVVALPQISKPEPGKPRPPPKPKAAASAVAASAGYLVDGYASGEPETPVSEQASARKNLNETAFFFPHLLADSNGVVRMTFTMPEALTEWRFMGFAHDRGLRSGYLDGRTITAKEFMVQPNPPRFLREGDELEFTAKVTNLGDEKQTGTVRLELFDAATDAPMLERLGVKDASRPFELPARESRSVSWRLKVPDGAGFLRYKVVGATARLADGEEGWLPVLSRMIPVIESICLPIRGPAEKSFTFQKLKDSAASDTLRHERLTVQMVSNPSWYAILALPYLIEYPYECSEQTFNRLYANALARHIANSNPRIRKIFDQWKNTPALDSPLEKNQDLKSLLIEETPWLRNAKDESQAQRNVGILFDANTMNMALERAYAQLSELQLNDGSWPWFTGGYRNDYITLYIVTGFGRLRRLGVDVKPDLAIRAVARLDDWIVETHRSILRDGNEEANHLSPSIAMYLYGRSFFLKDKPLEGAAKKAVNYFLDQARAHWLKLDNRQSQAHLALALHRFDDPETAKAILRSIKERSVTNEELGMFWRDLELSWWWFRAPIETQSLMIEAFAEVLQDETSVEDCKVWLLKQKQTQSWKTTKATADAVYALILRGTSQLASTALVEVALGGVVVNPKQTEAGTGFYEQQFTANEIKPEQGDIQVKKQDSGVAWGSVHWQYFEDISKVTPYEGTPLKLNKALFRRENTGRGPVLTPVNGPVSVGDQLVVRIELRTDRDMEYVHLKDQRGSGLEPVNVISRYKFQDGLAYYESTRDTASHFFIDYLPKGVYVFEYAVYVAHRGDYPSGIAEIQCMYAPEFNSHSASVPITAR